MMPELSTSDFVELLLRCAVEALLLVGVLYAGYRIAGLGNTLQQLGPATRRFAIAFVSLWTLVQLVDRWQYFFPTEISFYPLTRFAMYQTGHGQDTPRAYRFDGIYGGGFRREVNFTVLFGAVGLPSTSTRFRVIWEKLESGEPKQVEWSIRELQRFCSSAVRLMESRGDEAPQRIEFLAVTAEPAASTSGVTLRERVLHVWRP